MSVDGNRKAVLKQIFSSEIPVPWESRSRTVDLLLAFAFAGTLLSLLGEISHIDYRFDLLAHFRVQYCLGLLVAIVLAVFVRYWLFVALFSVAFAIHAHEILMPHLTHRNPAMESTVKTTAPIRVMSTNLLYSSEVTDLYPEYVAQINPDLIVLTEYTPQWDRALAVLHDEYPYRVVHPVNGPFGIALYSRVPLEHGQIMSLNDRAHPTVVATLALPEKRLSVIGTHPSIPTSWVLYTDRNRQLSNLGHLAANIEGPVILAGDLNTTPWANHFKWMIETAGLRDARNGMGIFPTFPSWIWPISIPIDHILVSNELRVERLESSGNLGSDHLTLWADLTAPIE